MLDLDSIPLDEEDVAAALTVGVDATEIRGLEEEDAAADDTLTTSVVTVSIQRRYAIKQRGQCNTAGLLVETEAATTKVLRCRAVIATE